MPSSPTTRNRLNLQGAGDNTGSWGNVLNAQVFSLLDESLDGVTTITVTANVALSSQNYATDQSRRRILKLIGSPASSFTITIPSVEKFYIVHNATTVAHTVKAGGSGVTVPANALTYAYCDGTNTFAPTQGATAAVGAVMDFAGAVAPAGWLLCYGQAVSRTAYAALFQAIGTVWGAGDGSTTFNLPDCQGRARVGRGNMSGTESGRLDTVIPSTLGASGGHQLLHAHAHASSASATSTATLGNMSADAATTVTYTDWTAGVQTVGLTLGGAPTLVLADTGTNVVKTATAQPGTVRLFGAPAVTTTITPNNATAGGGNAQNVQPCAVFNTIIYAGP